MLDCAGGKIAMEPNLGVGGDYAPHKPAQLIEDVGFSTYRYYAGWEEKLRVLEQDILTRLNAEEPLERFFIENKPQSEFDKELVAQVSIASDWLRSWDGRNVEVVETTFTSLMWNLRAFTTTEASRRRFTATTYSGVCAWAQSECP